MAQDKDNITLEVNGQEYGGWLSAQVVTGLDQIASQFAVEVTEQYPGGSIRIRPGDKVTVRLGDSTVVTGYVDRTPVSYDATSVTHNVSGRSRTADLADCCIETGIETETKVAAKKADTGLGRYAGIKYQADGTKLSTERPKVTAAPKASQWRKIDVGQTIAAMIDPYGIQLKTDLHGVKTLDKVSVSVGTKVAEAIKTLVQKMNYLVTDDEFGDLVLWSPDAAQSATDALVVNSDGLPSNVLEASAGFDYEQVFSDYIVFGQTKKSANVCSTVVTSPALGVRRRVLKLFESGAVDADTVTKRAQFESSYRLGKAKAATYTVQGWRQSDGSLWRKGMKVRIKDSIMNIDDEMIIEKVTYDLTEAGSTTQLDVVPVEALQTAEAAMAGWTGTRKAAASVGSTSAEAS